MEQDSNNIVFDVNQVEEPENISDVIFDLMVNPNLSPINYFNDFTDLSSENDNKSTGVEESIIELPDGTTLVSMSIHAMHHHLEMDPKKAAEILVSRAVRKMVCFGAKPLAINAMLYHINYSDPSGNFIASGAKEGFVNAAQTFGLQFSDRKIRFDIFEEQGTQSPTLIVCLLGTLSKDRKGKPVTMDANFKKKGNNIFLIGKPSDDICTSDYLEFYHGISNSPLPEFNLDTEVKLSGIIENLIKERLIESASPVGKGGLFFSLLRAGWENELGFDITTASEIRLDSFLFGESMGRLVVGVDPDVEDEFVDYLFDLKIPFFTLGHVTKGEIRIDDESFGYIDKMTNH